MAELLSSSGKSGGGHLNRLPVRVDLTALVDLAFLLITFFILTTTLQKNRVVPLVMPVGNHGEAVPQSRTMTIILGKGNQALYYLGLAEKPLIAPKLVAYGNDLQRTLIQTEKQVSTSTGQSMIVIIKPSDHSIYKNVVSTLDAMNITNVSSFAITKIDPQDVDLLKNKGVY